MNSQDAPNEQFDPIPVEIIPDNNEAEEQVLTARSGRVINMPSRETDLDYLKHQNKRDSSEKGRCCAFVYYAI